MDRRAVHVGGTFLEVDESRRLTKEPAPTRETVNAEELAAVLRDLRRDPARAIASLEPLVADAKVATESVEELVKLAQDLANLADPAIAAKRAEPILARIAQDYREGRFRDVVRLVWAVLSIYLLYERWRALVALLHLDHLAAEALGDAADVARALSDLDLLADAAGLTPLAAGEVAEQAAEHAGMEATGQAAQVGAHAGIGVGVKVAAAVVGAVVLAGAATGFVVGDGVWFNAGGDDAEEVREGGDAELVAFAVRTDAADAGTEDARSGWSPPGDAVPPGDQLEVCEPLFLYAFVDFVGMARGTRWSVDASNGGQSFASDSGAWNAGSAYTMKLWASSNAPVIPYGAWSFVTTIADEEVDKAEVNLVEAC